MKRASGSTCSRGPARQKNRQRSSKSSPAPSSSPVTCGRPPRGRKLEKAPSAFSTASRSILPRSAARISGTGSAGAVSSLKPPSAARSPARTGLRKSTVSSTLESGRSNGIPFHPSTIRSEEAPMPSAKRSPDASASDAACWASSARPRVKTPTTPGPEPHALGPGGGERQRGEPVRALRLAAPEVGVAGRLGAADELLARGDPGHRQRQGQAPASVRALGHRPTLTLEP